MSYSWVGKSFVIFSLDCTSDPSDHIGFLSDILSRIDKDKSQEAYVLLLATIARAKLVFGDIEGTKADMDAAWKVLDELSGVDSGVNAAYYSIAADYYKVIPPPSDLTVALNCLTRQKRSTDRITRTRYFISPAWISERIFRPKTGWAGRTTSALLLSSVTRYTTSASWYESGFIWVYAQFPDCS